MDFHAWLTGAVLAVLLAAFGWAGPVDAATCGFEESVAAAFDGHLHVDDHDGAEHSDAGHGAPCAHGHCHHAPVAVSGAAPSAQAVRPPGPALPSPGGSIEPPSSTLPGPDQPTRA